MMLNMDPPLHTRYRRLVNKGFTPRMVDQLHERIHAADRRHHRPVIERARPTSSPTSRPSSRSW